jgi:hypothetical protein
MAIWGSYKYLLYVFEHVGPWVTGELPVMFARDGIQHAVCHLLMTFSDKQCNLSLFTPDTVFIYECLSYTVSPWHPLISPSPGVFDLTDGVTPENDFS